MNACDIPGLGLRVAPDQVPDPAIDIPAEEDRGEAVLGGGCFWCTEAVFRRLAGVREVAPGYAGGHADTANYKAVCSGRTGHAEVIRIAYDPAGTSFGQLLKVFFAVAHDPTQKDRQGNDVGPQYRSAIFWHDEAQRETAREVIAKLTAERAFDDPIVTEVTQLDRFWPAEQYHQDYYRRNPAQPYCAFVISPKLAKYRKRFGSAKPNA